MSRSGAFAFWRDRDQQILDTSHLHPDTHSPAPGQSRSPLLKTNSGSTPPRPPLRPRPPPHLSTSRSVPPRHKSPSPVLGRGTPLTAERTTPTTGRARAPLLPPSWKQRQILLDGPSQSTASGKMAKSIARVTPHVHKDCGKGHHHGHGSKETRDKVSDELGELKSVSDIIGHLSLHSAPVTPTQGVQGATDKILLPTPHTVPATSTGKKFVLPGHESVKPTERWWEREKDGDREGVGRWERGSIEERERLEGGGVKRGSKSVERRGRGATVREDLQRRRAEGTSVQVKTDVKGDETSEVGERKEAEGEGEERRRSAGGKNVSLRELQSLSGARKRDSGSVKIKSSWTCYLDGPEEQLLRSIPPAMASPTPSYQSSPTYKSTSSHPPLSPTPSASLVQSFSESFRTSNTKLSHDYLRKAPPYSTETLQFWEMVDNLRKEKHSHSGFLSSPLLSTSNPLPVPPALYRTTLAARRGAAAKAKGHVVTVSMVNSEDDSPIIFQCSAELTVQEVIQRGVTQGMKVHRSSSSLWLKVCGRDEYLDPTRRLVEYVYVHNCLKLYTDVKVQVINHNQLPKSLACEPLRSRLPPPPPPPPRDLENSGSIQCVNGQEMNTLLDSYLTKEEKFRGVIASHKENPSPIPIPALVQTVISCVKLLCERLLYVETPSLSEAIYNLRRACKSVGHHGNSSGGVMGRDVVAGDGDMENTAQQDDNVSVAGSRDVAEEDTTTDSTQDILSALQVLRESVHHLVSLYSLSLYPGYLPKWWVEPQETVKVSSLSRSLRVKVCALHQIPLTEYRRFNKFQLEACVYHGGLPLSKRTYSPPAKITRSFFSTIVWNKWLNFGVPLSHLPRESRLCVTLHGLESSGSTDNPWNRFPIAWVMQRLFTSEGTLIFGPRLLGLWEGDRANPLDSPYSNITSSKCVLLELVFEDCGERVVCDDPPSQSPPSSTPQPGPPPSIYRGLKKMADTDRFSSLSMEDEKLIWTNRFLLQAHLGSSPRGLPLLLLSIPHWHSSHRDDVWMLLGAWPCNDPVHGLELLDPQLADGEVRKRAVSWLSGLPDDDLCDFLPQLVQSLRHDCYEASAMAQLLLTHALTSPRLAHHLYWHLRILVTAQGERYAIRYQHMIQALEILLGERLKNEFNTQVELVEQLVAVAGTVKATRDAHRQTVLVQELQRLGERFVGEFRLPLSPSLLVRGLDIESSSFFNSNTVPLKLSFLNSDPHGENVDIIFKVGDDLRQDILILQMIKLMEKIWLRAGLDLKMITYDCVATGPDQGMLEVVTDSATLRTIQTEHGVTGSFKDKPLSEWLMRHNPTDSDYKKAVDNFTCSCAGYCVATYVLGICDRHNDNIMVKKSGHMFHIDFGKILGNAQMFGSIKRDRVPFVLTRDMAYVINDGDKPTSRFQQFVDLCCTAYNELRRHTHSLLSLISLMLSSGLAELSSTDDVLYVRDALLPGRSDAEATYAFTKHIEDSLGSVATKINFFIHNLAQLKFSSPQAPPTLLTFVPQAYSIETDGKIQSAVIVAYYKRYYPDTHTVYQVQVTRAQSCTTLFRRYREFDELHNRLVQCFPGDNLPNFPGKTYLPGKSHARETVEKRLSYLNKYVNDVLEMDTRMSESDVVYTFFHCLIRDEQDKTKMEEEGMNEEGAVAGRVKVHMMYDRRSQSLSVMIRHVKDLLPREGSDYADPYVKMYLQPDPDKTTKQKTKIAKRTLHPTYNETFTYKVPPLVLAQRTLELSVWDASILLSKQCLAVATVELSTLQSELSTGCSYWVELHRPTHSPPTIDW